MIMRQLSHNWGPRLILTIRGSFNVHPMHGTWVLLHFPSIETRLPWPEFDPVLSGLAAQYQSHYTTMVSLAVT